MKILFGVLAIIGAIFCFYIAHSFEKNWSEKALEYLGGFALILLIIGGLGIWNGVSDLMSPSSQTASSASDTYQQLGHKIKTSEAKEEKDGSYYTDKTNKKIRYFTDNDGTITAIKYSYMPDPEHTTAVISEMDNLLDDSNLKYGNDKVDKNKTLLKGDNYNVYSPKHKKWYHMSMQKDDDGKVSEFSVWPGKEGQGDVE